MSIKTNLRHRRSVSTNFGSKIVRDQLPPPPPPRSAPTTFRKRRKDVGDRVFITSSSAIFVNYLDENLQKLEECLSDRCDCCGEKQLTCKCKINYLNDNSKSESLSKEICKQSLNHCDISNTDENNLNKCNLPDFATIRCRNILHALELQEVSLFIGMGMVFVVVPNIFRHVYFDARMSSRSISSREQMVRRTVFVILKMYSI